MRRSSSDTKAAILAAARERFATDGYDRATIRAIAADVAIDPSMVMRYFGSKERLFAAAADFDLRLPDLTGDTAGDPSRVGQVMARHFVERWEADDVLMVLLRAAVTHEEANNRIRAIFATQLEPAAARLSGDSADAGRRAGLVATQVLGMALCRYVLRLAPVVAMTHDEIVDSLGPTLQRYLVEPLPDRPG